MDQTQKAENPTIDMGGLSRVINLIYGYTTLSNRRLQQKGRNHVFERMVILYPRLVWE